MTPEEDLRNYVGRWQEAEDRETGHRILLHLCREGPIRELLDEADRQELIAVGELELAEVRSSGADLDEF